MSILVSVVMPTYNGEEFVDDAISSVLEQTYRQWELIVIDDGSTDNTVASAKRFHDSRIRILQQDNQGVAAARNAGVRNARGELIAFLDQDDRWAPCKLAVQVPYFHSARVGVVGSLMEYVGPGGKKVGVAGVIADKETERIAAARLMPFPPSAMIIRASVLEEVGGFDERLVRTVAPVDDLDLLSRIAPSYEVRTVPQPLGEYRIHEGAGSFARFYSMQRGTRFLQARTQNPALVYEEWDRTTIDTWSTRRREHGRFLYRRAGSSLASNRPVRGGMLLAGAFLVAPHYTAKRLLQQRKRT